MYFQKLESLKSEDKFKEQYMIIDSLDQWLALIPKTYKDRLVPELFSVNQEVPLDISFILFDKLVKLNILKERYAIRCSCGQILKFIDTIEGALDFIIEHNNDPIECDFCEKVVGLNTDNVIIIYKLVEKPNMSMFSKKKQQPKLLASDYMKNITLSDKIADDPERYLKQAPSYKFEETLSPNIRSKINFLNS